MTYVLVRLSLVFFFNSSHYDSICPCCKLDKLRTNSWYKHIVHSIFIFLGPVGHRNKILRNVKDVKRKEIEGSIPDEFLCPITRELMTDPVIAAGIVFIVFIYCIAR